MKIHWMTGLYANRISVDSGRPQGQREDCEEGSHPNKTKNNNKKNNKMGSDMGSVPFPKTMQLCKSSLLVG